MILLTGAAGFIGSNVLRALNNRGEFDILCVDDLTDGQKVRNISDCKYFYYCDYRDIGKGKSRDVTLSAIVHLGADTDTTNQNGRMVMLNNYSFSVDLLELAKRSNCPFIYASSAAVYGNTKPYPPTNKEHEVSKTLTAPYAYSKLAFDQHVETWGPLTAPRVIGLRFFNVYGPGEAHKGKMASVVYHMFEKIRREERCPLFEGSMNIYRDFVYVDDVVNVVLWALKEAPTGIYNVGTGTTRTFYELFECAAAAANMHAQDLISWLPFPPELQKQYQFYTCADLTRLRAAGYDKPFMDIEAGAQKYWEQFCAAQ